MSGPLRVVVVYPDLLGTYGDGGNGLILARRAEWRGRDVELAAGALGPPTARSRHVLPGWGRGRSPGPRRPHPHRRRHLGQAGRRRCGGAGRLRRLPDRRADVPGRRRGRARGPGPPGDRHRQGHRAARGGRGAGGPDGRGAPAGTDGLREPRGRDRAGGGCRAPGPGDRGRGERRRRGGEGAVRGRVVGTYMHGPVLARNPVLADVLLSWALGDDALEPLDDSAAEHLREERLASVGGRRRRRRRRRR